MSADPLYHVDKAQFLNVAPEDTATLWSQRTRPILQPGLQPAAPGVRENTTKLLDYLRSEMENIRFSNHSLEVTMGALELIGQRNPRPAEADRTLPVPLTVSDIQEFLRMKREQHSPSPLAFADPRSDSANTDYRTGGELDVEPGQRTTSTASSQALTEVSYTGIGDIVPSDDTIPDDSLDGTSIDSTALDVWGPDDNSQLQTPSGHAPTPRQGQVRVIPQYAGGQSRGPVKFPSRQHPMPFVLGLVNTPSVADPSSSQADQHLPSSASSSSVEATSPIPQTSTPRTRSGPHARRGAAAGDILDLTLPNAAGPRSLHGDRRLPSAAASSSTRVPKNPREGGRGDTT